MKILFIAPYPSEHNSKDGMVQRVKHIDNLFRNYSRTYLDIQMRKNFKCKKHIIDKLVTFYEINSFLHSKLINTCFRDFDKIYIHSITGFFYILWKLPFIDYNKVVLDAHGIFPEELKFAGSRKYNLFNLIERYVFSRLKKIICVTNAMKTHFLKKYQSTNADNYIIYNILPSFAGNDKYNFEVEGSKINVIYSGNLQAWQNIDLMLQIISDNDKPDIHYTILTGDPEAFKQELAKIEILNAQITLLSVQPNELPKFYSEAHYGFILRDDIDVNRVANPTKLIEYLSFGIIPIVKSNNIGDFTELGYEFVDYKEFSRISTPKKSKKNYEIYLGLLTKMKNTNLEKFVTNG